MSSYSRSSSQLHSVVLTEVQRLLVSMRRNRQWRTNPNEFQPDRRTKPAHNLLESFDELRWTLTVGNLDTYDRRTIVAPFLALITTPDTNGNLTLLALEAVETFVKHGVFDVDIHSHFSPFHAPSYSHASAHQSHSHHPHAPSSPSPMQAIVHALTHCRFEPSDSARDEVVLLKLLSLTRTCLYSSAGRLLSNASVWKLVKNCYSIQMQLMCSSGGDNYSAVLVQEAQQTFLDIVSRIIDTVKEQRQAAQQFAQHPNQASHPHVPHYPNSPHAPYGFPVLHKLFQLVATLCETVHVDLNITLKIDLIHGNTTGHTPSSPLHGGAPPSADKDDEHGMMHEEHHHSASPHTSVAPLDPLPPPALVVDQQQPATATAPTPASTAADSASASTTVTPAVATASPSPSESGASVASSPATASVASSPAQKTTPPPQPVSASNSPPSASHGSGSSLPPYSSAAYRCLLPLSELHALGFFQLPLPSSPTTNSASSSSFHTFGLQHSFMLGGVANSKTTKDIYSDWSKRSHLALQLLDTIFASFGQELVALFPDLLSFVQDSFLKFLLKNSKSFSNFHSLLILGSGGSNYYAGASGSTNATPNPNTTFNLHLLSYSLTMLQRFILQYREYFPSQLEMILNTVYLRVLALAVNEITTSAVGGNTAASPSASPAPALPGTATAKLLPADPLILQAIYDVKEVVLESLLDLLSHSWFLPELFVNYDCNIYSADIVNPLVRSLIKSCFPDRVGENGIEPDMTNATPAPGQPHSSSNSGDAAHVSINAAVAVGVYNNNHFLALRCLGMTLQWINSRCELVNVKPASSTSSEGGDSSNKFKTAPSSPIVTSTASAAAALAAAAAVEGSMASPPAADVEGDAKSWLEYVENWFKAQSRLMPEIKDAAAAIASGAWKLQPRADADSAAPAPSSASSQLTLPNRLLSQLHHSRLTKLILSHCINFFNNKPKKGLDLFHEWLGLFPNYETLKKSFTKTSVPTAEQLAEIKGFTDLLRIITVFDKTAIGLFIAEHDYFSTHIRRMYCISNFHFRGQTLDDSLRMFLEAFRLPVEAQQIDRCMQAFAETYHAQNPGVLANADAVHTLSFSLIMLNTDLHNELIKNKMTLEQFISNNRGINNGENIPPMLLKTLYYSIKYNEIKMSGSGINGDISDALWSDMIAQSKKLWNVPSATNATVSTTDQPFVRRYVRLDSALERSVSGEADETDLKAIADMENVVLQLAQNTPSIIPATLSALSCDVHLPEMGERSLTSSLPQLLGLYSDYSLFTEMGSSLLNTTGVIFDLFLNEQMIVRYEQRRKREEEERRKKEIVYTQWEQRFALQQLQQRSVSMSQSQYHPPTHHHSHTHSTPSSSSNGMERPDRLSRQSSADSEYCKVNGTGSITDDESRDEEAAGNLHQFAAGSPLRSHSPYSSPQSAFAASPAPPQHRPHSHSHSPLPLHRHPHHQHVPVNPGAAALASTPSSLHVCSLVGVLQSAFYHFTLICARYPQRFQPLFDRAIVRLTKLIIPPPIARAMNQAMGQATTALQPSLGDYIPAVSRNTVLVRKYSALLSFGSNAKSLLALSWLLKQITHSPLLLGCFQQSWAELNKILSYLLYLDLLTPPPSSQINNNNISATNGLSSPIDKAVISIGTGLAGALEDFCWEWSEKNGSIALNEEEYTLTRGNSNGRIRRDLLYYSSNHFGGRTTTSGNSDNNSGGVGSSLFGLFFSSSPSESYEAPFVKSTDMEGVELYLHHFLSQCNLPFVLLEGSRGLNFTSLKTLVNQLIEQSSIKNPALYNWNPASAAGADSSATTASDAAPKRKAASLHSLIPDVDATAGNVAPPSNTPRGLSILQLHDFQVLDEEVFFDLGEETQIANSLASNNSISLAAISAAHELHVQLPSPLPTCVCCYPPADYLALPFELRRSVFFLDVLTKVVKENGWRVERLWGPVRNHMMNIIAAHRIQPVTADAAASASAAGAPQPLPPLLVSSALVSLLSLITHLYHKENMREELMATLRQLLGNGSSHTHVQSHWVTYAASAPTVAIPPSANLASQLNARLQLTKLRSYLMHNEISTQFVCGIFLFIQTHMDHFLQTEDWECVLVFLQETANYQSSYFHGFALLWMIIMSPIEKCTLLNSLTLFNPILDVILSFATSRFASPVFVLKCVDLLENMNQHLMRNIGRLAVSENGFFNDFKSQAAVLDSNIAPVAPFASPRHLLQHIWSLYMKPLLHCLRSITALATDRTRVLYNCYHFLRRQRAQQESAANAAAHAAGFGLLRSQAPNASAASSSSSSNVPLGDYIIYIQEFQHVRQQCLLLLKQILVSENLAQSFSQTLSTLASGVSAAASASPPAAGGSPSSPQPLGSTWTNSFSEIGAWAHTCFFQLCLDDILFPLLADLSQAANSLPLFLESSSSFTLCRTLGMNLLSKVFLRHLEAFLQYSPANHFSMTWLTVLKTVDRYLSIGVHVQRQQVALVTTQKQQTQQSQLQPPAQLLPIEGVEWSSESGVLLTESIAESLKNLVLVMKAQGIFNSDASKELWELTQAILNPWLPFIPALQAEIAPPPAPAAVAAAAPATSASSSESNASAAAPPAAAEAQPSAPATHDAPQRDPTVL